MLIGICGEVGSGKDTFASQLGKYYYEKNYFVQFGAFASKLKLICSELFGVDSRRKDERDRNILQKVGEFMRTIDDNVWINYLLDSYKDMEEDILIITDVRYKNEAEAIVKKGGQIICLELDENERRKRLEIRDSRKISDEEWQRTIAHPSETGVLRIMNMADDINIFHFEINPNITKEEVFFKIAKYIID